MAARLLPEARLAAEESVTGLSEAGLSADVAEARLMLAEVALAGGDHLTALAEAAAAEETFERQRRERWRALAGFAASRARWAGGIPPDEVLRDAMRLAPQLESAGWPLQGLEARIVAARTALSLGLAAEAERVLAARRSRRSVVTADERSREWYAVALLRLARRDRRGALCALGRPHHRRPPPDDLRRHRAPRTGGDRLGRPRGARPSARLRCQSRRSVLAWAERWRARSLWRPDVVPSRDPDLARRLSELRHTVAVLEQRRLAGEATDDLDIRRHRLEGEIATVCAA